MKEGWQDAGGQAGQPVSLVCEKNETDGIPNITMKENQICFLVMSDWI